MYLQKVPKEIKDIELDFTPVEKTAESIVKLILGGDINNIIYHIYNDDTITVEELINILNKLDNNIEFLDDKDNLTEKEKIICNKILVDIYSLVDKEIIYVSNYKTKKELQKINFTWNKVDLEYIKRIVDYMKKVNFI